MERSVRSLATREGVRSAAAWTSCKSGVNRGSIPVGTKSAFHLGGPVLHEIRFAADGPWRPSGDAVSKGPEGRPKALVCGIRELDTGLDATEQEDLRPLSLHAGRGPGGAAIYCLNDEMPVGTATVQIGIRSARQKGVSTL